MLNVLVTGATGFFGPYAVDALLDTGKVETLYATASRDFQDWMTVLTLHKIDTVVHLAWFASPGDRNPEIHRRCLDYTMELGAMVKRHRPEAQFVFASTCSVYGDRDAVEHLETERTMGTCAYTSGKLSAEEGLSKLFGDKLLTLRFGSMMGIGHPEGRTRTDLVVNAFASDAYSTGLVEVWNPSAWKPVVHVQDAAGILADAVGYGWDGVYNVVTGCYRASTIADLVRLQTGCDVVEVKPLNGYRSCRASNEKLMKKLPGILWREVPEAIREFVNFKPEQGEKTDPARWKDL